MTTNFLSDWSYTSDFVTPRRRAVSWLTKCRSLELSMLSMFLSDMIPKGSIQCAYSECVDMVWFTVRYVQIVINTSCPQHCQAPTYISTISTQTYTAFRNRIFVHYYFDNDPHLSLLHAVSCYKWKQSTGALQVTTWSILLAAGWRMCHRSP